jgi:hypothetical protein
MKKILFAVALVYLTGISANAQTKTDNSTTATNNAATIGKSAHSKYAINYPVCKNDNGYTVCTQEELQKQLETPADVQKTQNNDNNLFQKGRDDLKNSNCTCSVLHNNIVISYDNAAFCQPYLK